MTAKKQWLAQRVAEQLRDQFLKPMRPGGRLASVRKLATDLGVCVETVRAAQKRLALEGVLEIRHGSGVYIAEGGLQQCIGIYTAFDILQPRTSSFHTLLPRALRKFFKDQGLGAEVYLGDLQAGEIKPGPSNPRFRADVAAGRLDGIAILNAPSTLGWGQWVGGLAIPAVGVHTPYTVDDRYGGDTVRGAVGRLAAQGCRRIAFLSWAPHGLQQPFRDALTECGLDYCPEWARSDFHPMLSGAGWEEFREIWTACREKPDGLLVTDDVLFDDVRLAISELGIRVPDQLRIVTHANKGADRQYPFPVTLVQSDPERYAEVLGGMLIKRMRGEPIESPTAVLPVEMVEESGGRVEGKKSLRFSASAEKSKFRRETTLKS